uniref:Uncharacterized protein n=1 Tax=Paramoeba aestuarina TaxID=180227 RepID=A0A7S4KDF6_9EUKA
MKALRKTQWAIFGLAFGIFFIGVMIVIPAWDVYWAVPTTAAFDLSLNLCPTTTVKNESSNSFHFVGYMGECFPIGAFSPTPTPSPTPSSIPVSHADQYFDPGDDYFDGGVFPISSVLYATKRVTGSLVWEIVREDTQEYVYETQNVLVQDSDLTGNFGVVGGGNISIIRNSPFNLAGWTNNNEECLYPPGCTYYPLLTTFEVPSSSTFLLPDSDERYLVRVKDVDLRYETNLTTLVPIDAILHFENRHTEDETTAFFFLILGFLMIDATPGIAYFLWFQEEAYYGTADLPEESGRDSERDTRAHLD